MADKEYETRFEMVVILSGGTKIISNGLSLDILEILSKKRATLGEMAQMLDCSKTSIQANVNSLIKDNILLVEPNPYNSRSPHYSVNCIRILTSKREWFPEEIRRNVITYNGDLKKNDSFCNAMLNFCSEVTKYKVTILPLFYSLGMSIASMFFKKYEVNTDELSDLIRHYFNLLPTCIKKLEIGDTIKLRLGNDHCSTTEICCKGFFIMGMLSQYQYIHNKSVYGSNFDIEMISDKELLFTCKKVFTDVHSSYLTNPQKRGWDFYTPIEDYSIYYTKDNEPMVITNPNMIDILEVMEDGPKTVKQISEKLDIKAITTHVSITKMVTLGLIDQVDPEEVRNIRYKLVSKRLFYAKKEQCIKSGITTMDLFKRFIDKEIGFYELCMEMQYFLFSSSGLKHDIIVTGIAKDIVTDYLNEHKNITPEEFVRDVINLFVDEKRELRLESLLPVRYLLEDKDKDNRRYEESKLFIETIVKTGLKELTGTDYPVFVDRLPDDAM